jgi:phosphoglycerate kinase
MKLKTVRDLDVKNKKVLLRVDYNVPISSGIVGDPLRIEASFETIRYLLDHGAAIILLTSAGRPKGKVVPEFSLAPVARKTADMLGHPVTFVPEIVGTQATAAAGALQSGEIMMLENLRFDPREEANDPKLAEELAALGEVYVDDAFANAHRAHASMVGIPKLLPGGVGLLIEKEVEHITSALKHPQKPLIGVIGGAKVSTKIEVLDNLIKHVNKLVIGGAMANTFLSETGHSVGASPHEPEFHDEVRRIKQDCEKAGVELVLPLDVIVAKSREHGPGHLVELDKVSKDDIIVDLGSQTVAAIFNPLDFSGSVIWNGPLGITEVPEFAHGSRLLADNIIEAKAPCVVGGGDTAAFVDGQGMHDKFTWVSTGGGASLQLIAGQPLPALEVLER